MRHKGLAAVILSITLALVAVLLAAEKLLGMVAGQALDNAGITLSYDRLELNLLDGKLAISNLLLMRQAGNKPLLHFGEARLKVAPLKLLLGDNSGGQLRGRDTDIYLYLDEESESESNWEPGTWLGYRNFIPGTARIDNLNLHWRGDDPEAVTRFIKIRTHPGDNGKVLLVEADAVHRKADLRIDARIATAQHLDGGLSRVGISAEISSQLLQSRLTAEGALQGAGDALNYYLQTEADSADIQGIFQRLNLDFNLHGLTRIRGRMEGDLSGFSLAAKEVSLDYMPVYKFAGSGRFDYHFNGDSDLDLAMEGELTQLAQLIEWLDLDVAELGSARASVNITGSLEDLLLRDAVLSTHSDKDLKIQVSGNLRVNNLSKNTLGDLRGIDVVVTAPNLSALQAWTGDLDFETGPWRLAALIREQDGKLQMRKIDLNARGTAGVALSAHGEISDAGALLAGDLAGVRGIALQASLASPSSKPFTELLGQDLRNLGPVSVRAEISGSGDKLLLENIAAETGDNGLHLALATGSLQLVLAPEFSYSNLHFPVSIELDSTSRLRDWVDLPLADLGHLHATMTVQQTPQGFSLPAFRANIQQGETIIASHKGSLQQLSPLKGLQLEVKLNGLPTEGLIKTFATGIEGHLNAGSLYGGYRIASVGTGFQVKNINIENRGSEQLKFELKGHLHAADGKVDMDLQLESEVSDQHLLQEVTGFELAAMSGHWQISGSQQVIHVAGDTRLGSTDLVSRLLLTIGEQGLTDIKGSVTSPRLNLQDVGLGRVFAAAEEELPEQSATRTAARQDQTLPLEALPDFPIDLILAAAEIDGEFYSAEDFSVHVRSGDGLYQLINLMIRYTGGSARVDATLDTRPELPDWTFNAHLDDFRVERLRDLGAPDNFTGNANTIFHLETRGRAPDQMIKKMDGKVALAVEDMVLKGAAYDRLAVDTLAWFYTGGVLEKETRFSCVMGVFDLDDGVAVSNFLFAESKYLIADGSATIDLPAYKMKLAITPRSKRRTFQIPGTIKVRGPLDDLRISTSALSTTIDTSAQVLLLVPSVAMRMFDRTVDLFSNSGEKTNPGEDQARKCPTAQLEHAPE